MHIKKRPWDFKRRILNRVYTTKQDMLLEEHRWLGMIKKEELNVKYYNVLNHHFNHWTAMGDSVLSTKERISKRTKEAMQTPEVRKRYEEGLKRRVSRSGEEKVREKKRQSMKNTMAKKFPVEQRKRSLPKDSDELKELHRKNTTERWKDPEYKKRVAINISKSLIGKPGTRTGHKNSPEHTEKIRLKNTGKRRTDETKLKISQIKKGKKWWTNGIDEIQSLSCPDGWISGRSDVHKLKIKQD